MPPSANRQRQSDFYPRPPRGGRRTCLYEAGRDEDISIHALREEGDAAVVLEDYEETKFLSTPSARRATPTAARPIRHPPYFYPRPPRGGRPAAGLTITASTKISIHALREEGDGFWAAQRLSTTVFLSTPSARRATPGRLTFAISDSFLSTPSARRATEGSEGNYKYYIFLSTPSARRATSYASASKSCEHDFYPRPPRGGRLRVDKDKLDAMQFLSTPSARRATGTVRVHLPGLQISIHALREEGDRW